MKSYDKHNGIKDLTKNDEETYKTDFRQNVQQGLPKDAAKPPFSPVSAKKDDPVNPLQADENLKQTISQQKQQQQKQSSPTVEIAKAKWRQHVGAAKEFWGELTDDEIRQSEGNAEKLSGLVAERYAIDRQEAEKQVKNFLDKCKR